MPRSKPAKKPPADPAPAPEPESSTPPPQPRPKRATPRKGAPAERQEADSPATTPRRRARAQPRSYKEEDGSDEAAAPEETASSRKRKAPAPAADEPETKKPRAGNARKADSTPKADANNTSKPAKKPRKTAAEKAADAMPLAARTPAALARIGAHVSAAGGVHNAVEHATHIGANAFALFLKSQRKWANPPLQADTAAAFKAACAAQHYPPDALVLPHGSYLVNLASADEAKGVQAFAGFTDDLARCETLGVRLYNFHPGNTNGAPRDEAIARLAGRLNDAHAQTQTVITVLENMAAAAGANTLGGPFEDLRDVIAGVRDHGRVGVCLDSCHLFAAGYDVRSPAAYAETMAAFDRVVGLKYLRAWHLNDSKGVCGSHRDLHQRIGLGFLGLRAFHNIVNDPRMHGLPMVLETPIDYKDEQGKVVEDKGVWAREIKLLESLVGMDAEGDEFKRLEAELAAQGQEERQKMQAQFDKKQSEAVKPKGGKGKGKKKKKAASEDEDGDDSE